MNITLWILQIALAAHTALGAFWKFSNSAQSIPSLKALPAGVWTALIGVELICALLLALPLVARSLGALVPVAALVIALEMALFVVLHLRSGEAGSGPMIYWIVVAAICLFIAVGRQRLAPL